MDGNLYVGVGACVKERFLHHNRGGTPSTRHRSPFELIYVEEHSNRSEAVKRERFLKSLEGSIEKRRIIAELTAEAISKTQAKYL